MASSNLMSSRAGGMMMNPFQFLQREMNRLFEDILPSDFGAPLTGAGDAQGRILMPRMEVRETDKELRVVAELPGVTEKDIDVSLDDDVLTIRAEKKIEKKEERENTHFTERSFGIFQRSMRVPYRLEPNQVNANFANGVLTVTLPKNEAQTQAHRIPVETGSQSSARHGHQTLKA
jgi:HSP20 family protein